MITIMDIAELWPDYLYPSWFFIFGQLELTRCVLPPAMALHTLVAKLNSRNLQWKDPLLWLGDTPSDKIDVSIYYTLVKFPQWLNVRMLSQMRFPFKLNLCSTELLLNLNEIYIRNKPRCHQSPCSWTKRRASKHELLFKIYTLYIISPIAKMTYTNTNCKFQVAVKLTNANLTIQVI